MYNPFGSSVLACPRTFICRSAKYKIIETPPCISLCMLAVLPSPMQCIGSDSFQAAGKSSPNRCPTHQDPVSEVPVTWPLHCYSQLSKPDLPKIYSEYHAIFLHCQFSRRCRGNNFWWQADFLYFDFPTVPNTISLLPLSHFLILEL